MAAQSIAPVNSAGNIEAVLKLLQGGSELVKGSSTTQTSSSNISQQGVTQLLQQILSSNQGLGAVAGAQKSAGLYNSSTNAMLTNDLLSRAAGEVEMRRAGTTTTNKKNAQLGGSDILSLLGSAAASKVFGPTLKKAGSKFGLDGIGDKLADSIFGGGAASAGTFTEGIGTSGVATDALGNIVGAGSAALDALAGSAMAGTFADGAAVGTATLADGSIIGAGSAGLDAAAGIGAAAGAGELAAGGAAAGEAAAGIGLGEAAAGTAAAAGIGEAATAAGTAAEGAGIAEVLGEIAIAIGWVICTELYRQNRMSRRFYFHGSKVFNDYPKARIKGYYIWAIPCVKHLRKNPNSWFSRALSKVFNARAEYLAACAGEKSAKKTVLGFLTNHGLYGFSWTLSWVVPDSYTVSWKGELYGIA